MIEEFITGLDRALDGPTRAKRRLINEAAAGLNDAQRAYRDEGCDAHTAAARAVADFGPVPQVAPAFQAELDVARARHTAAATMLSIPLLAVLWNRVWDSDPHQHWNLPAPQLAVGVAAACLAVGTSLAAAAALLATGRLAHRWSWSTAPRDVRRLARTGSSAFALAWVTVTVSSPDALRWPPLIPATLVTVAVLARITASSQKETHRERGHLGRWHDDRL